MADQLLPRRSETESYDYFVLATGTSRSILLNESSRYVNLGDWIKYDSYAVFDGNKLELKILSRQSMRRIVVYMILLLTWYCGSPVHACQDIAGNGFPTSGLQHPGRHMQDTLSFTLERSIPGDFAYMSTDVLGNLYLIGSGNRLMKRNANGDSVAVFNEVRKYGNPSDIDVSNPMKVIVYYRNFSTAVILDRFLSVRNTIDLRRVQIFNARTVANSYDNNLWVLMNRNSN